VCVCVRACARARVCVCARACVRACVCVCRQINKSINGWIEIQTECRTQKCQVLSVHAMRVNRTSRRTPPHLLTSALQVNGQNHAPVNLPQGKNPGSQCEGEKVKEERMWTFNCWDKFISENITFKSLELTPNPVNLMRRA